MSKKIFLSPPHMSGKELQYVNSAFETNWISSVGENIDQFEKDLSSFYSGQKQAVALNSGTSAIHMALLLAGVQKGDEVLCQSFTFAATAFPITYCGAIPVFIDSEEDTWNMCPVLLEKAIRSRIEKGKKPKAIIFVDLYGVPAKISELTTIAKKYEITLIEDAAEALGSYYKNKPCGIFGDYGVLSFNGNKIITTSGGGALICREKDKEKALFYATQAKENELHYQHEEIGYNYRMSNVLAGIGRAQLEVLSKRVEKRKQNYDFYKSELSNDYCFLEDDKSRNSNRWLSCMLLESRQKRDELINLLSENAIESRPLWKPLHLQPVFSEFLRFTNGVSEKIFTKGICLPSGSNLSSEDLKRILSIIKTL